MSTVRSNNLQLGALVLATLICIGAFLSDSLELASQQAGGWRKVDLKVLNERIDRGDLSRREASWYRLPITE